MRTRAPIAPRPSGRRTNAVTRWPWLTACCTICCPVAPVAPKTTMFTLLARRPAHACAVFGAPPRWTTVDVSLGAVRRARRPAMLLSVFNPWLIGQDQAARDKHKDRDADKPVAKFLGRAKLADKHALARRGRHRGMEPSIDAAR